MKIVHMIFNAHLDPVWLWPWTAGLDETLATCRSACDRLDAHPDIFFTRGEAWVYQQIERCAPALFERICKHIAAGRWEIAGGWWIQPDCNFPAGHSFSKQMELGREFFMSRFGQCPRIAFNPDSFGHTATLPQILQAGGQDTYVFMRPQEHEKKLPARLFRWRGYTDGPEVLTFRIASTYNSDEHFEQWRIHNALSELPDGITHTMLFLGIGDHGGGPTEKLIAECRKVQKEMEEKGIRLVFSTMSRFFDAVRPEMAKLPLVTGELQYHAVGCYSVHRPIKTGIRRAEDLLRRAELLADGGAGAEKPVLDVAWQTCCLNQFHDTLGGTCLPSAYVAVLDQVGSAAAAADQALTYTLRRKLNALPDEPYQRAVFWNASDRPFDGYAEAEPWFGAIPAPGTGEFQLLDESGAVVPHQQLLSEAMVKFGWTMPHIMVRLKINPGELRILRMRPLDQKPQLADRVEMGDRLIANDGDIACDLAEGRLRFGDYTLPMPRLELIDDPTDTWSHGVARYPGATLGEVQWSGTSQIQRGRGPMMASLVQHGTIGQSPIRAEWRVYAGEPFVELRLRVTWNERLRLLKLVLPTPAPVVGHTDGISGGQLDREADGKEVPIRDWMLMRSGDGPQLGIVTPDTFAGDIMPESVRITLLRSCYLALHDPYAGTTEHGMLADRGQHEFRFRFYCGKVSTEQLESSAHTLRRPPLYADLTRGMKP